MRYAARLVALVVATLLGCALLFDLYFLRDSYLDSGRHFPAGFGMQEIIATGAVLLAFLLFCLLVRFFGRKDGKLGPAIGIVIGLLALAYVGYAYRVQIARRLWHWRHGNFVALAGYDIPVPRQWMVLDRNRTFLLLFDTASGSIVNILASSIPRGHTRLDLNSWASSLKKTLGRVGVRFALQRSLKMGDETVVCLSDKDSLLGRPLAGVCSWMCMSSGGLSLNFLGPQADVEQFDAILRGVRRK